MKEYILLVHYGIIYIKNYLLESLAIYFPKIVPKPLYIGLSVGTVCNLKCKQCDIWKIPSSPEKYLKTKGIKKILKDLRNWLGPFRLVFTGAEPLIRKDIIEILEYASKNDIYTVITSNGWLIDKKIATKMVNSGVNVINISLDGSRDKTHDYLRGRKGSFERAIKSLDYLVEARDRENRKRPSIYINTVISEQNISQLEELVLLAEEKNLDAIRFQALESKWLFGEEKYNQKWFKKSLLWPKNYEKVKKALDKLKDLKVNGLPIKNTLRELKDLKIYYQNPWVLVKRYKVCFVGVRNFSIDEYGKVKLCFGMRPVGDLLKKSPRSIWYGNEAMKLREVIRQCRRSCLILPCNRREELGQMMKVGFKKLKFIYEDFVNNLRQK